jgi:hypothetical protein
MNTVSARSALAILAVSAGLGLTGCVVNTVGAPCTTDDNCPSGQHCGPDKTCQTAATVGGGGGDVGGGSGGGVTGGGTGGGVTGGGTGGGVTGGGTGGGVTGGGGGTTGGGGGTTGGGGGATGGGGGATGGGGGATGGGGGATGGGGGGVIVQPRIDVISASGRMQGGTFTLDMQVGDARDQAPMTRSTTTLQTGAAVKP